jgi:hypothetical protein
MSCTRRNTYSAKCRDDGHSGSGRAINGFREDLAAFFTAIDVIHFRIAILSQGVEARQLEEQQKARNDVLLMYRKILMRLNMNEPLHQQLEKSLE